MRKKLKEISVIQFGVYEKPRNNGNAAYLQAKHFDDQGNRSGEIDIFLHINRKNESHLLNEGDVLLTGKGYRNFAWTYRSAFGPAIASSVFFVIKPDRNKVIPEFLTILFNLPQTQAHFQTLGAGSSIPSIRKSELEALTIKLPSLVLQEKVVVMKQLHDKDMKLSRTILTEKQRVYQSVIHNLIYKEHE